MSLQASPIARGGRFSGQNGTPLGIPANTVNRKGRNSAITPSNQWELLDGARRLLNDKKPVDKGLGQIGVFKYRVAVCHRNMMDTHGSFFMNKSRTKGEYTGIQRCGSVWHCPMCAGKVSSKRRDQLSAMLAAWTHAGNGGAVHLVTYTHSHDKSSLDLAEQLARMQLAYRGLCNHKSYKQIIARAGGIGAVRAMEVTHGDVNGWHPHYHALLFVGQGAHWTLMKIRALWIRQLIKFGLSGLKGGETPAERRAKLNYLKRRAVDVRGGAFAAEYVAKFGMEPATEAGGRWGLGSELTKGHMKNSDRLKGRTPFSLLSMYCSGTLWAGDLFREYGLAFNGKKQLVPSPKLRKNLIACVEKNLALDMFEKNRLLDLLNKVKKTEQQLADEPIEKCDVKAVDYSPAEWRLVLMHGKRGEFAQHMLDGGDGRKYLEWLAGLDPPVFAAVHGHFENLLDTARLRSADPARFILSSEVYALNAQGRAST